MTYEKLTGLNMEVDEEPVIADDSKTVWADKISQLKEALQNSGLAVQNFQEVLEAAGINLQSNDPIDYDYDEMEPDVLLAILTAIVQEERISDGTAYDFLESGLIEELIGCLEMIDYENRPLPAWIESIADKTLADLQHFPSDKEITLQQAIKPHLPKDYENGKRRKRALSKQDEFDITDALHRKAKGYGLYLDSSTFKGMDPSLLFNIPFRVRKVPIGSDGPDILFRFQCGGLHSGFPSLEIRSFADGIDAISSGGFHDHIQKTFPLTSTQIKELQDVLISIGAPEWEEEYINIYVCDGTQWELTFVLEGKKHHSEGSNEYPNGFDSLVDYLNETFDFSF